MKSEGEAAETIFEERSALGGRAFWRMQPSIAMGCGFRVGKSKGRRVSKLQ